MLFIKRLQASAKVKAVRSKIRKAAAIKAKLSKEYKRVLKSEGSRLGKALKRSRKKR